MVNLLENIIELRNPEQPSNQIKELISKIYNETNENFKKSLNVVEIDKVPFHRYWQNKENLYRFHPMAYGYFLSNIVNKENYKEYLNAFIKIGHNIPNGGLLWYYPNTYNLNRMNGNECHPSCISQGQLLGSITNIDKKFNIRLSSLAKIIFLGLKLDFYRGGLNFENKTLLEIPLFYSAPEIILNGWLHCLLHLYNYIEFYKDEEAVELFNSNCKFLAEILPNFHDEVTNLSLYSDLSPYKVKIFHDVPSEFNIIYVPNNDNLSDKKISIDLNASPRKVFSLFDNQIIKSSSNETEIYVNFSKLFDTYICSKNSNFSATFNVGQEYNPFKSNADSSSGEISRTLISNEKDDLNYVNLTENRKHLFCGYPTNFIKNTKNAYHSYHIVALACLIAKTNQPIQIKKIFQEYMNKWIETTQTFQSPENHNFENFETIFDKHLVKHQMIESNVKWKEILKKAQI